MNKVRRILLGVFLVSSLVMYYVFPVVGISLIILIAYEIYLSIWDHLGKRENS
jgi:hypothetical protein